MALFTLLIVVLGREEQSPSSTPSGQSDNPELAQCRAESERYIIRCWTEMADCNIRDCSFEVACEKRLSSCAEHTTGPYGKPGTFYCDTRNPKNSDFKREIVIRDACR